MSGLGWPPGFWTPPPGSPSEDYLLREKEYQEREGRVRNSYYWQIGQVRPMLPQGYPVPSYKEIRDWFNRRSTEIKYREWVSQKSVPIYSHPLPTAPVQDGSISTSTPMTVDRVEVAVVTMVNSGGWQVEVSRDDKNNLSVRKST